MAVADDVKVDELKIRDWYRRILRNGVTHSKDEGDQEPSCIQTRVEFLYPHVNHETSFTFFHLPGLSPRLKSVLFLLKNDLYPSQERLYRLHKADNSNCRNCSDSDTHGHFIVCPASRHIFELLHNVIEIFQPRLSVENVISGDIGLDEDKTFAIVWILALSTEYFWDKKSKQSPPSQISLYGIVKANLEILSYIPKLNDFYTTVYNVTKNNLKWISV